jgi:hypothetical protein
MNDQDDQVYFNNVLFNQLPNVVTSVLLPDAPPPVIFNTGSIIRRSGNVLLSTKFDSKIITYVVYILAPTRIVYQSAFDMIKILLLDKEKPLLIDQRGQQIQYIATISNITEEVDGTNGKITIEFTCSNPFGQSANAESFSFPNNTLTTFPFPIIFGGTAPALPQFRVVINSTSGGLRIISIGDSNAGKVVNLTDTFNNNDVLLFDMYLKKVFKNNTSVDYSGTFPEYRPGRSGAYYTDNYASRNVSLGVNYNKQYL